MLRFALSVRGCVRSAFSRMGLRAKSVRNVMSGKPLTGITNTNVRAVNIIMVLARNVCEFLPWGATWGERGSVWRARVLKSASWKGRARGRIYYREHRKEKLAYAKEYLKEHRERIIKRRHELQAANGSWWLQNKDRPGVRERIYKRQRKWSKKHPEAQQAVNQRYRARLVMAPINDFTVEDWRAVLRHYAHMCAYCGGVGKIALAQEHIVPLSRGGAHHISNIVSACRPCNSVKGAQMPAEAGMMLKKLPLVRSR